MFDESCATWKPPAISQQFKPTSLISVLARYRWLSLPLIQRCLSSTAKGSYGCWNDAELWHFQTVKGLDNSFPCKGTRDWAKKITFYCLKTNYTTLHQSITIHKLLKKNSSLKSTSKMLQSKISLNYRREWVKDRLRRKLIKNQLKAQFRSSLSADYFSTSRRWSLIWRLFIKI
jgi:hypothetical protein